MNFSEFIRRLRSDPTSRDPAFLCARESSPEFMQAATESDRFEKNLGRALLIAAPDDLLTKLQAIGRQPALRRGAFYALAATLFLAVLASGIAWRMNPGYKTVEQYVAYHYQHDGPGLLARGDGRLADNTDEVLARFGLTLTPEARHMVGLIRFCPTPAGKGIHMVLNTDHGAVTVIFMPDTTVMDGEMLEFDDMQAQLVALTYGSAAVIGTENQRVAGLHHLVQSAFIATDAKA